MDSKESVDLFNKNCIGTKVVYWPTLLVSSHKNGKRTLTRSKAFLSESGSPVVFFGRYIWLCSCRMCRDRQPYA